MNYYNDNDKFASKWIRELIKDGLIPEGYVDDRSIEAVTPKDLDQYDQCHFFAGIGGWPRALELAGWDSTRPVWTASLPCQPFSCAGQQQGEKDERHLWPVFFGLVEVCRPPIIFGEQVASKDGREWLGGIQTDLETLGYTCAAADLPAASVGAPHKRNRLFWVAHTEKPGLKARDGNGLGKGQQAGIHVAQSSPTGRVADSPDHGSSSRDGRGKASEPQIQKEPDGIGESEGRSGVSVERVADSELQGHEKGMQSGPSGEHSRQNHWSNSILIPCADGKYRRVPGRLGQSNGIGLEEQDLRQVDKKSEQRCSEVPGKTEHHLEIEPLLFPLASRLSDRMGDSWDDGIIEALNCFPLSGSIPGRVGLLRGAGNSIVAPLASIFIQSVMEVIDGLK